MLGVRGRKKRGTQYPGGGKDSHNNTRVDVGRHGVEGGGGLGGGAGGFSSWVKNRCRGRVDTFNSAW